MPSLLVSISLQLYKVKPTVNKSHETHGVEQVPVLQSTIHSHFLLKTLEIIAILKTKISENVFRCITFFNINW